MRNGSIIVRLSPEEREALEEMQRRLQAQAPGARITNSDAVRRSIHIALSSTPAAAPVGVAVKPGASVLLDADEAQERQAPRKRKKE